MKLNKLHKGGFSLELFLAIFSFGYLLVMTFPTKKLDRYILPMFPFFTLIAVNGYFALYDFLKNKEKKLNIFIYSVFSMSFFLIIPIIRLYPYYFTYTSPLFLSAQTANRIIAQKPFGVGIPELKEVIFKYYGDYPTLGFIDAKPMRAIYMNSRIFDIREAGTKRYDIVDSWC